MAAYPLQELYRDIGTLPPDKLAELGKFVEFLRFTIRPKTTPSSTPALMRFAGCWRAMDKQAFDGFTADTNERRHSAFAGRRGCESRTD